MVAKANPHFRRKTEVIVLRPGQSVTRGCDWLAFRTFTSFIRRGEALVVICRKTRKRFVFICGKRVRRTRVRVLPKRSRIVVFCVRK